MGAPVNSEKKILGEALLMALINGKNFSEFSERIGTEKVEKVIQEQTLRYLSDLLERYGERARSILTAVILYSFEECMSTVTANSLVLNDLDWRQLSRDDGALPKEFSWLNKRVMRPLPGAPHRGDPSYLSKEHIRAWAKYHDHQSDIIFGMIDDETRSKLRTALRNRNDFEDLRAAGDRLRSAISTVMQGTAIEDKEEDIQEGRLAQPQRISILGRKYDLTDIHTSEGVAKTPAGGAFEGLIESK